MAIFGENEVARGEASIRNLETREQTAVPRARRRAPRSAKNSELENGRASRRPQTNSYLRRASSRRCRQERRRAGLGAPHPRSRRRHVPRYPRSRRRLAGRGPRERRADERRQAAALGVRRRRLRRRAAALARHREPEARDRRGRDPRARDPPAQRGEDAAVPDRRGRPGVGGRAARSTAISICAGRGCSTTSACATASRSRSGNTSTPTASGRSRRRSWRSRRPKARATSWCRAASTRASSTRCRSRRRSSSRS